MSEKRSVPLTVKVRPEIRKWLTEVAEREFRTVSAEVSRRLEVAYREEGMNAGGTTGLSLPQ